MANITENLLNTTVAAADMTSVTTGIGTIITTLDPTTRSLTDEERQSLFSLDVNNKVFVEEALNEMTINGALLPSAVNVTHLSNDLTLFNQMDTLESMVVNLLNQVRDTKRLAGHEAYAMSLTVYTLYKSLAAAGIEGARQSAERLAERFAGNGGAPAEPQP